MKATKYAVIKKSLKYIVKRWNKVAKEKWTIKERKSMLGDEDDISVDIKLPGAPYIHGVLIEDIAGIIGSINETWSIDVEDGCPYIHIC